jgi:thymidylate synthase (FAD)
VKTELTAEYLGHFGDDLMVVNVARVSFDKESSWFWGDNEPEPSLFDDDKRLIRYLANNNHWTPFSHPKIQFRLTLPIIVARQWEKHRVGCVRGYDLFEQNEVSRRYVTDEPTFFMPKQWREAPVGGIKQGSGGPLNTVASAACDFDLQNVVRVSLEAYNNFLRRGVAPEMARMALPQNMMTQWIETGSLYYWFNLCRLRLDSHAQKEIQLLASQVADSVAPLFPMSWHHLLRASRKEISS